MRNVTKLKNRKRNRYTFANINFLGECNLNCFFCLGKDLEKEFSKYKTMETYYINFPNLSNFLLLCKEQDIQQIYLTGQNTDPLLYYYLADFINYLHNQKFYVGMRTNGQVAIKNLEIINKCDTCLGDAVSYTILSLNDKTARKISGEVNPNWEHILESTIVPYRVSIVVTKYNINDIMDIIKFLSRLNNKPQYIQIRKISTDHRYKQLRKHIKAFSKVKKDLFVSLYSMYELAPITKIEGLNVCFWETVRTSANSMNYFTNGIISKEYFIIEGYEKAVGLLLKT
jgi:molybdenum cofactor biosynthesis enzyme MoaA